MVNRHVVFPAALAIRGETGMYAHLSELREAQWAEPSELLERQRVLLAGALRHAAEHVPLYRERWPSLTTLSEPDALKALRELPFVSKTDLQESFERLKSDVPRSHVSRKTTGGSTGQPVSILKDGAAIAHERAASWLAYAWNGVQIGDRGARFWGSPKGAGWRRMRYELADLAMNRLRFSAFAFTDADLEAYWRRCLRQRPDYFYGYVSMVTEFARHVRAQGHDGRELALKAVITTAEALTTPQRQLLRDVFGAPVQNEYGCGELGPIAYECPEGRLHVVSENLVIELIGEDGRPAAIGETGEVVATDLRNRAMPLVRYRLGDHAVRGAACPCGRGFPVLDRVWGRAYDFVQDRTGRRYHGEYFMYIFEDLRDAGTPISQFRITQESESALRIDVVSETDLPGTSVDLVERRIHGDMPDMRVEVRRVPVLERAASGKTRVIRNLWLEGGDTP